MTKLIIRACSLALAMILAGRCVRAGGVELVVIEQIQVANALAGVVTDPNGDGVPDVVVKQVSSDWQTVFQSTKTDATGHFALGPASKKNLLYLELTPPAGFNSMRVRVKIQSRSNKQLRLQLELST